MKSSIDELSNLNSVAINVMLLNIVGSLMTKSN